MKISRRLLGALFALAASPFFAGCGRDGCKGPLETPDPTWAPKLSYSYEGLKPFRSGLYPLAESALVWSFQLGSIGDAYDPATREQAPDRIRIYIWVAYAPAAIRQWRKDGYITGGDTASDVSGTFEYSLDLDPRELKKGEYTFSAADTSEGLHPNRKLVLTPSTGASPTFTSAPFSGFLRIDEDFTAKTGKFSFRMESQHGPGQVTVLASTVTFLGYEESLNCGWD